MDLPDPNELLDRLADGVGAVLRSRAIAEPRVVGIHTGGVWVAHALARRLGWTDPIGVLDISFHRDDFGHAGLNPAVHPSSLPWDIDGRDLVLVDDVLYTGRTVRAALNELFDWGRPAQVVLAALIERDGRELPVAADAVGARLEVGRGRLLKLRGPDPLSLAIVEGRA
jgi:pyrimidine operon attenuation protein/uracil phosphoribosyltransferase